MEETRDIRGATGAYPFAFYLDSGFTGTSHLRSEVEKHGFNRNYVVLKNAFKNTLIKPREDYVDVFFRHLEQCASIWTPQQFYAPYTSLIQASGDRKSTRLNSSHV